jgi:hypothetical protein
MSMRAISRVLGVPLGTVFAWIERHCRSRFEELASCGATPGTRLGERWSPRWWTGYGPTQEGKGLSQVFTCLVYTTLGLYLLFSVGIGTRRPSGK